MKKRKKINPISDELSFLRMKKNQGSKQLKKRNAAEYQAPLDPILLRNDLNVYIQYFSRINLKKPIKEVSRRSSNVKNKINTFDDDIKTFRLKKLKISRSKCYIQYIFFSPDGDDSIVTRKIIFKKFI